MPNWKDLLEEVKTASAVGPHDLVRRKYLRDLYSKTGRNTIVYYSGWLQKEELQRHGFQGFSLNEGDKNGFMTAIHGLDREKGLDLILHTPGGSIAATESLVNYLRSMFGGNIRAFIPQIAMSAGTMLSLACREVYMGKHSSLGPIDPQVHGLPAHGIIEEFERAADEIRSDPSRIPLWQPIMANYNPTIIGECEKAIAWCNEIVKEWLLTGMLKNDPNAERKADQIILELGDHALTKSHDRHISLERAANIGIVVKSLEEDDELQDLVLTVHHACIQTLASTASFKITENHCGVSFIQSVAPLT